MLVVDGLQLVASKTALAIRTSAAWPGSPGKTSSRAIKLATTACRALASPTGFRLIERIANAVGGSTKFRSLEFGVQLGGADVMHRIAYLGAGQPIPPEEDPAGAFSRIFADISADSDAGASLKLHRATVLDAVTSDYNPLNKKLGTADRRKLDAHLASIRDVEVASTRPPSSAAPARR